MNFRFLISILALVILIGCAKKAAVESTDQNVSTQTELTLMDKPEATSQSVGVTIPEFPSEVTTTTTTTVDFKSISVQQIQQALKNANLYDGKIDGSLGPKTKNAIMQFQEQNGLNADGKVGPKTWVKLSQYLTQTAGTPESEENSLKE